MFVPENLRTRAERWAELKRWERRELARDLRTEGLSYREVGCIIPVSKSTLSAWCRDIALDPAQIARLDSIRPDLTAVRRLGAERRQAAMERAGKIRDAARAEVSKLWYDPFWVAGLVAYWAEGDKSKRVSFTNSDTQLVSLFIQWCYAYLGSGCESFTISLHLHDGQDEPERQRFWADATGLPLRSFRKSYIKSEGTGHRKNVLYNGTASVYHRASGALLHKVLGWIDGLSVVATTSATLSRGR